MKKETRQKLIVDVISEQEIETQADLIQLLEKAGVQVTQATLSRDIRELGIVKQADITGDQYYRVPQPDKNIHSDVLPDAFEESVLEVTQVQFVNIIKTTPNDGNRIAAVLDDAKLGEIKGTLAGYDTVITFSSDAESAISLNKILKYYI
ncbi:arginine repressor [Pediococcus claussenii]|uniref:Arginine repressor n=1 Tax=Pediococcus claussenii (strain ATCC BAA-344 / DSM 14800 / JCM 18046 / KCTC 3811 / LMG 21948 / P06) TaxID=701521 RepID=G8PDT7_PEDCP|nr:arginine repressor, DNA-binding domain protein [Pediococcus claussenii]AEV95422.1 arginine repressor, DNA binding domain protein [Pediococcus claussenii ATCC BAA-344]ANZ68952.1 ArgR family transcriptional regulator [Pediococcus claussenii]ANZ70768.1 ArgR family transcriptional regulator [Pediococcus claussenii]KRN19065.1 hypothetical protein IV79_GL001727 [Pediococcus claussenii]